MQAAGEAIDELKTHATIEEVRAAAITAGRRVASGYEHESGSAAIWSDRYFYSICHASRKERGKPSKIQSGSCQWVLVECEWNRFAMRP